MNSKLEHPRQGRVQDKPLRLDVENLVVRQHLDVQVSWTVSGVETRDVIQMSAPPDQHGQLWISRACTELSD